MTFPTSKKTAALAAAALAFTGAGLVGVFALPALADLGGASAPHIRAAAIVNSDGSVVRSKGVTGVRKIATGQYCVRLDSDINARATVPVATSQWTSAPWDSSIFVRHDDNCNDHRDIFVGTGTAAGARDTGFHVIVP
ncbi:hypothetical protein FHS43_003960 [Streptosporangium becharense]|uniref:Uncharacterized protein n=1 Tax=Streptosporangium becharense TaxID=1816182 RepID=A0A7W9II60_9ACTN|nr:hypothetical protein [Streptosporangium becharense]MBB2912677.1 hypothetical protein [Streptosporangium becharense]MBB5820494.1 hypothetical protein [Streptosporangium becharense]